MTPWNLKTHWIRAASKISRIASEISCPTLLKSNYSILTEGGQQYSRIYHSHIRKCAGTSFNYKFLGNSCNQDPAIIKKIYKKVAKYGRSHFNGKVYCGWNKNFIESGRYFYAWSHIPFHSLHLPPNTFTITVFRDPVQRLISHFKMIYEYYAAQYQHPCMNIESKWLGPEKSVLEFANNMPKEHLLAQLYHYSSSFSISEAIERVESVQFVSLVEQLDTQGYRALTQILPSISLPPGKVRVNLSTIDISQRDQDYLREILNPEYEMLALMAHE